MRSARRAFSFTEVLFAVMILGLGFIMVAAIFPVAIQQTRNSTEEGTGAAVSRGGANHIEKVANNFTMPPTQGIVVSGDWDPDFKSNEPVMTLSTALRGGIILQSDRRVAWVPFYKRAGAPDSLPTLWPPYAQVFMIPVYVRTASEFMQAGAAQQGPVIVQNNANPKVRGMPLIRATIRDGQDGAADTISFTISGGAGVPNPAAEGAYVIIANAYRGGDVNNPNMAEPWNSIVAPDLNGRIYRLGNAATAAGTAGSGSAWELMPGFDFEPLRYDLDQDPSTTRHPDPRVRDGKEYYVGGPMASTELTDVLVFVVGRGRATEGISQEVGAYTTFVNVN